MKKDISIKTLLGNARKKIKKQSLSAIDECADDIYRKLTMRKFRRAHPTEPGEILQVIKSSLCSGEPIKLVMFWGCGHRDSIEKVDQVAIERLLLQTQKIECSIKIILNDMHSRLNRIDEAHFRNYYNQISEHLSREGIRTVEQSEIWQSGNLTLESICNEVNSGEFDEIWRTIHIRDSLIQQAKKHFCGDDCERGAKNYLLACMRESPLFTSAFSDHLFLTYNSPEFDICLPNLPKLYIYSYRRGKSAKPWFL